MRTSIVFLSILGAVFLARELPGDFISSDQKPSPVTQNSTVTAPLAWKLEFLNAPPNCAMSIMPDKDDKIVLQSGSRCSDAFAQIDNLTTLKTDTNGDITLYGKTGEKVAKFIESESGVHESIWPKYPLMTLAKLN